MKPQFPLFLLLLAAPSGAAAQQPPALPPATPKEIQLRTQLGEVMWELGMTQAALAAVTKERDGLKAGKPPEEEKK